MDLEPKTRDCICNTLLTTAILVLATPRAASAFAMYSITDLGTIGGNESRAVSINNLGQVVGSSLTASGAEHAFVWSDGQISDLGALGSNRSYAFSINDVGQIVGFSVPTEGEEHAVLWQNQQIIDLGLPSGNRSFAFAINNQGQAVGGPAWSSGSGQVFLWENGQSTNLPTLGGSYSEARAINNLGWVAGAARTADGTRDLPVLWSNNQLLNLGDLGGGGGYSLGINDLGQVVGVSSTADGISSAFLWSNGQMINLGRLPNSSYSQALDINNRGQVIGYGASETTNIPLPFIWENGEMVNLNNLIAPNSGWYIQEISSINDQGQIVGHGIHAPTGQRRAILLSETCRISPGQQQPLLPTMIDGEWMRFNNVPSGLWYDPPASMGFTYQATGSSLFTDILNFPCGVDSDNTFTVSVGNLILGEFSAGQSLNFVQLLGQGVSEFTISGINANLDPNNPTAFPIQLEFDTPTASFSMKPIANVEAVPEPSSIIGSSIVGIVLSWRKLRRKVTNLPS